MKVSSKLTLILVFAVLLPALIMSYVNFYSTKEVMRKSIQTSLQNGVSQRAKDANRYVNHLVESLEILASNKLIEKALVSKKDEKIADFFDYTMRAHKYYDMFLIAKDGEILFTIKKENDLHKNLNKYPFKDGKFSQTYKKAIQAKKTSFSNFYFYTPSKRYAAFIVIPVIKKQKVIGAVAVQLDIQNITSLANDYSGLGKSGTIVLAQKQGNRAIFINKLRNDNHEIFTRSMVLGPKTFPMKEAFLNHFGSGVYHDFNGVEVITAWGYIEPFKIGMVLKVNTEEAYADIAYLKNLSIFMGFVIFAFTLYIIYRIGFIVQVLEKTQNRYRFAIEGTQDGLWDWDLVSGKVYFSLRLKNMLGYSAKEMESSWDSWVGLIHKDDVELAMKEIKLCHKDPSREYSSTYRLKHKSGEYLWILDRGKTYFDENGKAIRMSGFHTDITQHHKLEAELKKSQHQFEQFMRYIPAIVVMKNKSGVILYANQNANNFFNQESIVGKTAWDILPPDDAKKIEQYDTEILEKGHIELVEESKDKNGNKLIIRVLGFSILLDKQKHIGLVMIDITQSVIDKKEIKNKDEIMIAQSRHAAMGEMISMIAHQWRQPISVIAMDANNILADIELEILDEQELRETSQNIIKQTQELSKTIDDFREFFKPDKNVEDVFVVDIVQDALGVIGKSLQNNNIEVLENIDKTIRIKTYARELMQVLINIIKNAKEALTNKDGVKTIKIEVLKEQEQVIIRICDNGKGIDNEILDKIFHPYFTTKGEKNGTGLGLYMSKTIIEKHLKGELLAYNQAEGVCFEININGETL